LSKGDERRSSRIRFGDFAVDLRAGELHKAGVRVPLQQQPFRVLSLLVEKPLEVVTRDELRRELWPDDTFVDFEHGLNVAIARVREALGDSAEQPRFVETLPKRGYRFLVPVEREIVQVPLRRGVPALAWVAAVVVMLVAGTLAVLVLRRVPPLSDRDAILVADFVNETGEDVFDATLRTALTVHLDQSPFLRVVPREKVRTTLKQMRRPEQDRVVGDVAREACQRAGATVSVDGRIARIGNRYIVTLESERCDSGEMFASTYASSDDKDHVLDALDSASTQLRERFGESRAMLKRFNRPLQEATTRSLDALKTYSLASEMQGQKGELAAEPLFKQVIEIDPECAMAYVSLSALYYNTFRLAEMRKITEQARPLLDRLTERERLRLELRLCTIEPDFETCGRNVNERWIRTYPLDFSPYHALCFRHIQRTGDYEQAIALCREALRLGSTSYTTHLNIANANKALNRYSEAARVLDTAFSMRFEAPQLHALRYEVAFATGDRATLAREARTINERPSDQGEITPIEAQAAAFDGRWNDARRLDALAAQRVANDEWKLLRRANWAIAEAAGGVRTSAADFDFRAPRVALDFVIPAVLSGDVVSAEAVLRTSGLPDRPPDRRSPLYEVARVMLMLSKGDSAIIAEMPAPATTEFSMQYRLGLVYMRGLAYLRAGDGAHAVKEFDRLIARRGVDPMSPLYPIAFAQRARAFALTGEIASARKDYETFLQLWKDADANIPILQAARAEYANLLPH
jgi:DNA-binding winged helix-turn-helix (wHTH) protein/tetratricopeptide (TPR) repeat protein